MITDNSLKIDDTIMGYMYINESTNIGSMVDIRDLKTNHSSDLFYITFEAILQDFDIENRNHRYYDGDNIWECIMSDKIQSMLRANGWFGEFDHPAPEKVGEKLSPERIQNVPPAYRAFKIMNPRREGNVLKAKIQSAQNDVGISFGKEVLAGWIPQFSCRAIAVMVMRHGKPYVIVKRLITYDAPWYPSHACAQAISKPEVHNKSFTEAVMESASTPIEMAKEKINDIMIPLKEILLDIGKKDVNSQLILESFDLPLENICGFDDDHKNIIIRADDNYVYSNIRPESAKKVRDFFGSF